MDRIRSTTSASSVSSRGPSSRHSVGMTSEDAESGCGGGHSIDETPDFNVPSLEIRHGFLRQHMDRDFAPAMQDPLAVIPRSFVP